MRAEAAGSLAMRFTAVAPPAAARGRIGPRRAPAARVAAAGRKPVRVGRDAEIGRAARGRAARLNAAAALLVLLSGLFHVWTALRVGQLGYALSHAQALGERLDEELHGLTIELAAETSPGRLEREAARRLGLRPPSPGQVVVLR